VVVTDAPPGTNWLIDKAALMRLGVSAEAAVWAERIERGFVHIATVTLLEGLVVLHNDEGFDLIAEITGQRVHRLAD
jgi:predicted nucleic acid-binding protein